MFSTSLMGYAAQYKNFKNMIGHHKAVSQSMQFGRSLPVAMESVDWSKE
jgi:hypothetical protein